MNGPIILHQLVHPSLLIGGGGGEGVFMVTVLCGGRRGARDGISEAFHAEMQFPSLFGCRRLQSTPWPCPANFNGMPSKLRHRCNNWVKWSDSMGGSFHMIIFPNNDWWFHWDVAVLDITVYIVTVIFHHLSLQILKGTVHPQMKHTDFPSNLHVIYLSRLFWCELPSSRYISDRDACLLSINLQIYK